MERFRNKYRIPSARLQTWDYGNNGAYFITICTNDREHYFGEISDNTMQLNEMGTMAGQFWEEIPVHFPYIELGEFVVMPNHTHGILIIDKNGTGGSGSESVAEYERESVETRLIASLRISPIQIQMAEPPATKKTGGFAGNKNPMLNDNISRVIRWYKGRCSFEIKKSYPGFAWQPRFHDHIIRDAMEFERIQNYIANNPKNWKEDKFYS